LIAQLIGLERRTARSGRDSIDHGPGAHDDVANAVAGALVLAGAKVSWFSSEAAVKIMAASTRERVLRERRQQMRGFY
jgi:hypothetical protein